MYATYAETFRERKAVENSKKGKFFMAEWIKKTAVKAEAFKITSAVSRPIHRAAHQERGPFGSDTWPVQDRADRAEDKLTSD